ncbi:MAG: hypothetical protein KJ630_10150 [Proteobacteria bacterium]|nr:hypothetical protein [Pseudomonadota bacterium]
MIGESSSISTLVNNEKNVRDSPVQNRRRQDAVEEDAERSYADVTSFSPQALALARNVAPPGESAEQEQVQPQGRGQGGDPSFPVRSLDIRI